MPNIHVESPRKKALLIARYLRDRDLTGITSNDEYHHIRHNFLGLALLDRNHSSLPLISGAIYCHIATQFGLDAQLCGFPFHVYSIIHPSPGFNIDGNPREDDMAAESIYMDPFRSVQEIPVSSLESQLSMMGTVPSARVLFLGDASTREIVLRCGRNIRSSLQSANEAIVTNVGYDTSVPDATGAFYASLWSSTMLRRQQLREMFDLFTTHYPTDVSLIEQYILPLFQNLPELYSAMRAVRATDAMPKRVRRRTKETEDVRYKVGQVFRHKRYNYQAVITGWDTKCDAEQTWIEQNGVDRLQKGRNQSFYHSLYTSSSLLRKCAELRLLYAAYPTGVPAM